VFDSKKKMKVATGSNLKHKLSAVQRRDIDMNQCLLHMYTNQVGALKYIYLYILHSSQKIFRNCILFRESLEAVISSTGCQSCTSL